MVSIVDMMWLSEGVIQKKVFECLFQWRFLERKHHFGTIPYCGRATIISGVGKTRIIGIVTCVNIKVYSRV